MSHLQLTPEGPPPEDDGTVPIDDPDEPMTDAALHELELERAADEGMIEPPAPETDVPGMEAPEPEDVDLHPHPSAAPPGRKTTRKA